jgi:hypothetical protein
LQTENAAASVQLGSQDFIRLAESLQLSRQVSILALQNGSMSFEGLLLGKQVIVVVAALGGCDSKRLNISSANVKGFLFLLEAHFSVADLN